MIDELQMDIIRITGSLFLGLISKIFESVTTSYTLFALINLIAWCGFSMNHVKTLLKKTCIFNLKSVSILKCLLIKTMVFFKISE